MKAVEIIISLTETVIYVKENVIRTRVYGGKIRLEWIPATISNDTNGFLDNKEKPITYALDGVQFLDKLISMITNLMTMVLIILMNQYKHMEHRWKVIL